MPAYRKHWLRIFKHAYKFPPAIRQYSNKTKLPFPQYERSKIERKPKLILGIMAVGVSSATISAILYYENVRRASCLAVHAEELDSVINVTEPITKTVFPSTLFGYESSEGNESSIHWLLGSSVRCMLNLCSLEIARAYSYALYIEQDSLGKFESCKSTEEFHEILLPNTPIEHESAQNGEVVTKPFIPAKGFEGARLGYVFKRGDLGVGYYEDLIGKSMVSLKDMDESEYPSTVIRLIMLHNVKTDHISHGFDRGLLPRIRKAQKGKGKDALRELTSLLRRKKEFKKGTILEFVRLPRGKVIVRIDGEEQLKLNSEIFSWALFDTYYGRRGYGHMNETCKEAIRTRAIEILQIL